MVNTNQRSIRRSFVTFAAVNASLGTFLFYYVITVFNSIQEILQDTIFPEASLNEISFLASSPFLGAVLGSLFIELIGKNLGRRFTMILTKVVSIIGVILTLFPSINLLIIGRLLTGFDGGAAAVLVNIYIAEISEDPLRGQLGVIPGIATALGVLLAFLLGTLLPFFIRREVADIGYRILLALPGVISLIIILNLLFLFKFETPFYLVSQKKEMEAKQVLELLYDDEHSAKLKRIILERDYIFEEKDVPIRDLFKSKYRKAFGVSFLLTNAPSLMGGVVYTIFSLMIFSEGETSYYSYTPMLFSNLIGILGVFGALLTIVTMAHYAKRKPLAILGCIISFIINFSLAIMAFSGLVGHIVVKILIVVWMTAFSTTAGPIGIMYPAETLPEVGVGITIASAQGISFLVTQAFLPLQDAIGYGYVFLMFAVMSLVMTVLLSAYMIESKNRSKLEMLKLYGAIGEREEEEENPLMHKID